MALRDTERIRSETAISQWSGAIAATYCEIGRNRGFGSQALRQGRFLRSCGYLLLALGIATSGPTSLDAQALPAASKVVDLQVGTAFSLGNSDYQATSALKGFGFYTSADFRYHFGIEAEFHQLEDPGSPKSIYERTYEIGPRYVLHFGPFAPYTKLMAGRGVFNFPPSPSDPSAGPAANLAYNIWAVGIGSDYSLRPSLNVRIDYEYQRWNGFPPNGLSPEVFSFGVAYHFH